MRLKIDVRTDFAGNFLQVARLLKLPGCVKNPKRLFLFPVILIQTLLLNKQRVKISVW